MTYTRLNELIERSKLTKEQLTSYLNVDEDTIARLENGTESLSVTLIEKLCDLFGCTTDYLIGADDACDVNEINAEDLNSIAAINRIVANISYMNDLEAQ